MTYNEWFHELGRLAAQWLTLLPHSRKVPSLNPPYLFSLCMHSDFTPFMVNLNLKNKNKDMSRWLYSNSNSLNMNMSLTDVPNHF